MAGVTVQKNYVSSGLTSASLANNWMVLVFGVTSRGPATPTLVQTYANFESQFGTPVQGVLTHAYVQLLLNSGVPVLFKRVTDDIKLAQHIYVSGKDNSTELFTISATTNYTGVAGKNIWVSFTVDNETNNCHMKIAYSSDTPTDDTSVKESYYLGMATATTTFDKLLYNFISNTNANFSSNFVTIRQNNNDFDTYWKGNVNNIKESGWIRLDIPASTGDTAVTNATEFDKAIAILMDYKNVFWRDNLLKNAAVYYPQLRLVTCGGLVTSKCKLEGDKYTAYDQNTINHNLGKFANDCGLNFRVLVDYPMEVLDKAVVRDFAKTEAEGQTLVKTGEDEYKASGERIAPSTYAYCGYWGSDTNGNYLPGSAGFLTALGLSGYNVYSRRVAGSSFSPAFVKPYQEIYVDAIKDWQNEESIQLNPIVNIDIQGNLAIMGSSTLALPTAAARNPEQALDIILVSDYVTNILHNIAFSELEVALDRLSLNSLANRMSQEVEKFVTSRAITRYDFTFDTTQLGKIGINCTLYFAIGLEEVELTVTSVYDTTAIAVQ